MPKERGGKTGANSRWFIELVLKGREVPFLGVFPSAGETVLASEGWSFEENVGLEIIVSGKGKGYEECQVVLSCRLEEVAVNSQLSENAPLDH